MFEKMPTESEMMVFNHEHAFGIVVRFSEKDFGFGEITLAVDKATGEVRYDPEEMNPEHCGRILERTVGSEVLGTTGGDDG